MFKFTFYSQLKSFHLIFYLYKQLHSFNISSNTKQDTKMLKGLKKGKVDQQEKRKNQAQQSCNKITDLTKQNHESKDLIDFEPNLFPFNQSKMKENYIIEEDDQKEGQKYHKQDMKTNLQELIKNLKQKAFQILSFYQQDDSFKVQQQLNLFDKMQKQYQNQQNQQQQYQEPLKIQQGQIYEGFPVQNNEQTKPQTGKGRFEYNFNYEQQDEENDKSKKSLKRSNKSRPIMRSQKIQDYCIYCPDNQQIRLISASNYVYLAFPKRKTFQKYWHFILAPVQHQQTTIGLNQDVLTELSNYKKCLLQMFDKKNYLVIFFEQFSQQNSHIYIECLAVPFSKGQDFPFFFKQSLETIEGNWTTHNSIIKIEKEKGGLQRQIPKKIKYFYIDFSLGYGYAHVIENEKFWKRQFVYEVLATALGVQLYEVKSASEFSDEELNKKEEEFKKMWEPYDWTKCL